MMKNDLDFIKARIENSGVNAPGDMDEAYVAGALQNVTPQPVAVGQPKRGRRGWAIGLSATAAVLVLTIALGIVTNGFSVGKPHSLSLPGGLALTQFTSYDQVAKEVDRLRRQNNRSGIMDYLSGKFGDGGDYYVEDAELAAEDSRSGGAAPDGAAGGDSSSADAQSHSETYEQVAGVNEADIIKTDGRYIYCVEQGYSNGHRLAVFSAQGEDSRRVATIDAGVQRAATEDEADFDYDAYYGYGPYIEEFYVCGDRLVVLCNKYKTGEGYGRNTAVQVYDISDIGHITLLDSITQSGSYDNSRMIGDVLYTVSSYTPYDDRMIPVCGRGEEPEPVPASCIYTLADNTDESFLVVSAYNTLDHTAQTLSKSILGGVDDIYCSENHMYIYSTVWEEDHGFWTENENVGSQILKVDLTDGVAFTAYAAVEGRIDDQYALDEYNGDLRVATTSAENGTDVNNLFVLNERLEVIGAVKGFAKNESIKAVRYLGDTAYVITYEQTDPLFVIDLSEPKAPEIVGEVKITGFSTMLAPVGEDKLLGIGYHTENESYTDLEVQEGVKLALFDISDKENPRVLDSRSYVDCSSEAQYNPKALVVNPDRNDYVIPLNYCHWTVTDAEDYPYGEEERRGGALNFRVDGDRLTEIAFYEADHAEVDRCVYVGDTVYMTCYEDGELKLDTARYQ